MGNKRFVNDGHSNWSNHKKLRRLSLIFIPVLLLLLLAAPPRAKVASPPNLMAKANSTRAVAVESTGLLAEPFAPNGPVAYGDDSRTRIILFANNLNLAQGETASAITADAEDGNHQHYPLTVEYVGTVPGFTWMSAVVVRLHDNLGDVGDVLIGITLHNATSNRVRIGIGHVGGGPPDDIPAPVPTPDLGPKFSWSSTLPGRQCLERRHLQ
ncbi:MAG TPA: hypothetical protein VI306_19460 [Pyrinomonadaceae bacterium]